MLIHARIKLVYAKLMLERHFLTLKRKNILIKIFYGIKIRFMLNITYLKL